MFKIYLYNWASDFNVTTEQYTLVEEETEVLSIPVDSPDDIWLLAPAIKAEVNKAESFDFTVMPGTEYYNAFIRLKTWIRVTYDGTTIFWGLVKTINNSSSLHKRSIHAEGVYTTLNDSPVPGKEEDLQDSLTARDYLEFLINNHNGYIEEPFKKFSIGNISVELDSRSKKRKPTSWTDTLSELDKLIDEHGGYVRARYNDNWETNQKSLAYIDWVQYYFRDLGEGKRPTIKLSRNLIDISKGIGNNEIFTRLIPIGHKSTDSTTTSSSSSSSKKESSFVYIGSPEYIKIKDVPSMISNDISEQKRVLEADGFRKLSDFTNAEDNYGVIYLPENFSNASNVTDLKNYALEWIKHNYYGIVPSFSVKALDMHMLGEKDPQILVGDVVDVTYPEYDNNGTAHTVTRKLICKAIQYNLLNPEANTYTVGVPCDATDFEYGTKSTSKKSTSKSSASSAASTRKPGGGGYSGNTTITWGMVLNWLLLYYYSISDANVVDWTETRWTTYKQKAKEDDPDIRLLYIFDKMPYNTFAANKEIVFIYTEQNGTDADNNPIYEERKKYTYAKFKRPDSDDVVHGRILGHYSIDRSKTKPAQAATHGGRLLSHGVPIDSTKKYGNVYDYGVCATDDGHAYTFNWNDFYVYYRRSLNTENVTFSTYFEIEKTTTSSGGVDPASLVKASNGMDGENIGPVVWKNHDGKTTAEIADEQGWSTFGYLTDDDGNVQPAIKLNDTITYTDKDGNTVTKSGFVTAQDLNLPEVPSFTTKVAAIDNAIIERATIMELRAAVAELGGDEAYGEDSYEKDENGNLVKTKDGKWKLREGTKFITNSRNMVAASGVYGVREATDPLTGKPTTELYIKDGAGFKIEKASKENPGHKSYWGVWDEDSLTGGIMAEKINGESNVYINGDHINIGDSNTKRVLTEATRELGAVVGQYVWNYDHAGNKIGIKGLDGSGSYIWRNGAAYGIWDEGTLTAGVMVTKINDETTTHIKGDRIKIGNRGVKSVSLTDAITINSEGFLSSKSSMWVQGDFYVTRTNGSGGTLRASNVTVGIGGSIQFDDRSSALSVTKEKMATLLDSKTSHVKITTNTATGEKTLWYLPAGVANLAENWIPSGNFSSATANAVVNWKGGGSVGAPSYMIVTTTSGKELYKANFGGGTSGYQRYFTLVVNNSEIPQLVGKKYIGTNVYLNYGEMSGSGTVTASSVFYSKYLYINAEPVWNNGYDDGYQDASKIVKTTYPKENQIRFAYPTANVVGGSIRKSNSSDTYTVRYDDNNVYLSTPVLGTANSWNDKITLYHGKYAAGRNYERSIIYTRFAHDNTNKYYIEPYEDASNPHSIALLSEGKLKYKLGQSENNNRVIEIQDANSKHINSTPTFNFPVDRLEVLSRDTDKTDGTAKYTLSPVYGNIIKDNVINSVSGVQMLRGIINEAGIRTITLQVTGPRSNGNGNAEFKAVTLNINDYSVGVDDGKFLGRKELLDQGYKKYSHAASFTCYNISNLGTAGKRYYFYCDSHSVICSKDDDLYVHW